MFQRCRKAFFPWRLLHRVRVRIEWFVGFFFGFSSPGELPPPSHGEDAIEAELREKVAARDESRGAAWQALRDAPASLLRAVGGGAAGPESSPRPTLAG